MANLNGRARRKNTYDAIVVGSGITGGWAAKELTEAGLKVLMIERVQAIAALLEDGLARAARDAETAPITARMQLRHGDACETLAALVAPAKAPSNTPATPTRKPAAGQQGPPRR